MAEKTLSSSQKWFLRWVSPGFDWLIFYTVDPFQDSDSQAGSADKYSLLFWRIFFLRKKNRCEKFYWNFSILRSQKIEIGISALWVKPLRNLEFKDFAKWVPPPPFLVEMIFSDTKYLRTIFGQFHFLSNMWYEITSYRRRTMLNW